MRSILRFVSLIGFALGLSMPAWCSHGTYVLSYGYPTGGTYTSIRNTYDDYSQAGGYGGSGNATIGGTATCTGAMTFQFTWVPSVSGDLPPAQVAVAIWSEASATGASAVSVTDGLGDAPTTSGSTTTSTGTHYFVMGGGNTVTVTVDPESTGTGGGTLIASAAAFATVAIEPISVSFNGTMPPPSGDSDADQALPGQEVQAYLAVPFSSSVTSCTWAGTDPSFIEGVYTGTLFISEHVWTALTSTDLTQDTLTFYGVGMVPDDSLACSATATFLDGSVQTVAGIGKITFVVVPHDISATASAGAYNYRDGYGNACMQSGGFPPAAVTFLVTAGPPPTEFSVEGYGLYASCQELDGTDSTTVNGDIVGSDTTSTEWYLDGTIPYDTSIGWQTANGGNFTTDDTPMMYYPWTSGETIVFNYDKSFRMLDVYTPPSNGIGGLYTSFSELPWSWDCNAYFYSNGTISTPGSGAALSGEVQNDWANFQYYGP